MSSHVLLFFSLPKQTYMTFVWAFSSSSLKENDPSMTISFTLLQTFSCALQKMHFSSFFSYFVRLHYPQKCTTHSLHATHGVAVLHAELSDVVLLWSIHQDLFETNAKFDTITPLPSLTPGHYLLQQCCRQ